MQDHRAAHRHPAQPGGYTGHYVGSGTLAVIEQGTAEVRAGRPSLSRLCSKSRGAWLVSRHLASVRMPPQAPRDVRAHLIDALRSCAPAAGQRGAERDVAAFRSLHTTFKGTIIGSCTKSMIADSRSSCATPPRARTCIDRLRRMKLKPQVRSLGSLFTGWFRFRHSFRG